MNQKRSETPEYQAARLQGAINHLEDLERRGIIRPDQQNRLNHYRNTGTLPPSPGGIFS